MTPDQDQRTQILKQLRAIKWILAIMAFSFLVISVAVAIWIPCFIRMYQSCKEIRPIVQWQPYYMESQPYSPVWQPYVPEEQPSSTREQPSDTREQPPPDTPKPSFDFPTRAEQLLSQEKYSEVIALAEKQRKTNPEDPQVYYYLGMAYYQTKDFQKAVEYFTQAQELSSGDPYTYDLGMAYYRMKEYNKALKYLTKAQKQSPNDPYKCYYLGMTFYHMKDFKKAIEYLTKAQKLSPSWEKTYTGPYIKAAKEALDSQATR